jgi:hydroxymethylbilane synthase
MIADKLRIISRESPLAMWQARHVRERLCAIHPGLAVEILGISTEADRFLDRSLDQLGGKGAFVKELEQALLECRADLAVHSMKDVTIDLPEGLRIAAILEREDCRDAFVSLHYKTLEQLPLGARVGTSSLRRRCQLAQLRPDLEIRDIRGNVGTRLRKLDAGEYDALILAAAGLLRLGQADRIRGYLPVETLLPAIGQGALGLETRADDKAVLDLIRSLDHPQTHTCVLAERALSRWLNGGCHAPVAALATVHGEELSLRALVGSLDGREILRASISGPRERAVALGEAAGADLIGKGADRILSAVPR